MSARSDRRELIRRIAHTHGGLADRAGRSPSPTIASQYLTASLGFAMGAGYECQCEVKGDDVYRMRASDGSLLVSRDVILSGLAMSRCAWVILCDIAEQVALEMRREFIVGADKLESMGKHKDAMVSRLARGPTGAW